MFAISKIFAPKKIITSGEINRKPLKIDKVLVCDVKGIIMEALPTGETLVPLNVEEKPIPKGNSYAAKKSVAQRMMDIALLTSNANQLRYVLQFGGSSPTFAIAVTLIAVSLALQVSVGIYLIFRASLMLKKILNNYFD